MPFARIEPDGVTIEVGQGETLLEASLDAELPHAHACGGDGECSTCRVLVINGLEACSPPTDKETQIRSLLEFRSDIRLACQLHLAGDVLVRRLVLDDDDIDLADARLRARYDSAGELRDVAVLFADIRGFTSFSEPLLPYDVIFVLNRFLHDATTCIEEQHGGKITSFMGDGVMALFGLLEEGNPVLAAVEAGLDLLRSVDDRADLLRDLYGRGFEVNVGIHWGPAVVGTMTGLRTNPVVTAIGDTVNKASRIEAANRSLGTRLLISEAAFSQVRRKLKVGEGFEVDLPGRSGTHRLYEVLEASP